MQRSISDKTFQSLYILIDPFKDLNVNHRIGKLGRISENGGNKAKETKGNNGILDISILACLALANLNRSNV